MSEMAVDYQRFPISVQTYHRMVEAGVFGHDDRLELLEGDLISMPPIGIEHAYCVRRLNTLFVRRFSEVAVVDVQSPVTLDDYSEPQPDLMLLTKRADGYRAALPKAVDSLLVVEVSHSTLAYDRGRKRRAYARTGIAEVWIVDVVHGRVERYADLDGAEYRTFETYVRGDRIAPGAFPDEAIFVDDFLA